MKKVRDSTQDNFMHINQSYLSRRVWYLAVRSTRLPGARLSLENAADGKP